VVRPIYYLGLSQLRDDLFRRLPLPSHRPATLDIALNLEPDSGFGSASSMPFRRTQRSDGRQRLGWKSPFRGKSIPSGEVSTKPGQLQSFESRRLPGGLGTCGIVKGDTHG
jgi:hypothetical protein